MGKIDLEKVVGVLKKKESLVILFIVGLLLLVIALPTKKESGETADSNIQTKESIKTDDEEDYCESLERRLEEILSCIEGVGKVKVMITLKDTGKSVVEKDVTSEETSRNEEKSSSRKEETVYGEEGNSTSPYVVNTYRPKIQGVLVVAQGVKDPVIQQEIMEGVMALFEVESHKINIINME